jgi:sortase A
MRAEAVHSARAWADRALIAFGLACLTFYGVASLQAALYQRSANAEIDRMLAVERPTPAHPTMPDALRPLMPGELMGRIEIPRLKLSAVVAEGDDDTTLGLAVGHLPDTPLPWHQRGNVGFAAHRDGLFRPLEHIRAGDDIRVVTPHGEFSYRVRTAQIVNPDEVWVLAPTDTPSITLITCYPFAFVGNAPQRFIVKADLVGYAVSAPTNTRNLRGRTYNRSPMAGANPS